MQQSRQRQQIFWSRRQHGGNRDVIVARVYFSGVRFSERLKLFVRAPSKLVKRLRKAVTPRGATLAGLLAVRAHSSRTFSFARAPGDYPPCLAPLATETPIISWISFELYSHRASPT